MRGLVFSVGLCGLLAGCTQGGGGSAAPPLSDPPTAAEYVAGPYATRGREIAITDVRRQGCSSCTTVPMIFAAADLNGDGTDEILTGFEVLDARGNFTFDRARLRILTASGAPYRGIAQLPARTHPREAVVADFNGDGIDDIFVATHGYDTEPFPGEQNVLLLSRGAGRHVDASASHLPALSDFAHGADAGDIDGDGDSDIVVITNAAGGEARIGNYVLLNDGAGRFSLSDGARHFPSGAMRQPNRFLNAHLVDMTGDGRLDILMSGNGDEGQPSVLSVGDGAGRFARPVTLPRGPFGRNTWTTDIQAIDLDRDGRRDLMLLNTGRFGGDKFRGVHVQILMNEDGRFVDRTAQRMWGQNWPGQDRVFISHEISIADLNRDGAPDVVIRSLNPVWRERPGDMPAMIGLNDGTGRFQPVTPRWLDAASGFNARQLLPLRVGGRWGLVGHALFGAETPSGFVTYGQRVQLYR